MPFGAVPKQMCAIASASETLIVNTLVFPEAQSNWAKCVPLAGPWYPSFQVTDGSSIKSVSCSCAPCKAKGLFCKQCRTLKAVRGGKTPKLHFFVDSDCGLCDQDMPTDLTWKQLLKWIKCNVAY
jgi:hypothetical protein